MQARQMISYMHIQIDSIATEKVALSCRTDFGLKIHNENTIQPARCGLCWSHLYISLTDQIVSRYHAVLSLSSPTILSFLLYSLSFV